MTIDELLAAAGLTANDEIPIWDAEATGEPTKKITAANLASAVVTLAKLVTGVKGNAESSYRAGNVNLTPADIGAVGKSGDTMTGSLVYRLNDVDASKADNNVSSTIYPTTYCVLDKDNRILSRLESVINPNGDISTYLYVTNYNTSGQKLANNGIMLTMDKAGNLTYTFSHPEKVREALGITGEEIPLLSNPLAIRNGTLQYTAGLDQQFSAYKYVDLYFVIQGGYTNAIRLCPEYGDKTYKFGFFAWNPDDGKLRKDAVTFSTTGRYFTNIVIREAYGDNGVFNTADNSLYLYKAIGYKW